jgi:hypothetical protein
LPAGFTSVIFNDDFSNRGPSYLKKDLSCAGTPQTGRWFQGMYWEGQVYPTNVAQCNQINIIYDKVFNAHVLDLTWLRTQTDVFQATTVATLPLNLRGNGFSYNHGYIEVVARMPSLATGVWPSIWLESDTGIIASNMPPWNVHDTAEYDIVEVYGPGGFNNHPLGWDSAIHEYGADATGNSAIIASAYPPAFDPSQPHKYGLLWT